MDSKPEVTAGTTDCGSKADEPADHIGQSNGSTGTSMTNTTTTTTTASLSKPDAANENAALCAATAAAAEKEKKKAEKEARRKEFEAKMQASGGIPPSAAHAGPGGTQTKDLTRAERREIQERQRAEKERLKHGGGGGSSGTTAGSSKQAGAKGQSAHNHPSLSASASAHPHAPPPPLSASTLPSPPPPFLHGAGAGGAAADVPAYGGGLPQTGHYSAYSGTSGSSYQQHVNGRLTAYSGSSSGAADGGAGAGGGVSNIMSSSSSMAAGANMPGWGELAGGKGGQQVCYTTPSPYALVALSNVHSAVYQCGQWMRDLALVGSNTRCIAMMLALREWMRSVASQGSTAPFVHETFAGTRKALSGQLSYLESCRKKSIGMGNAIRLLKTESFNISQRGVSEHEAYALLGRFVELFITEKIEVAREKIIKQAMQRVCDGDVILTYGYSTLIKELLVRSGSKTARRSFHVIVVDSAPLFEARKLLWELRDVPSVQTTYCLITSLTSVINKATKVFLSASAVMSNGEIVSRSGTAITAMAARHAHLPVIVFCETYKFTSKVWLGSLTNNEERQVPARLSRGGASSFGRATGASDSAATTPTTAGAASAAYNNNNSMTCFTSSSSSTSYGGHHAAPASVVTMYMYDLTPVTMVDVILTEYGPTPPMNVGTVIRDKSEVGPN